VPILNKCCPHLAVPGTDRRESMIPIPLDMTALGLVLLILSFLLFWIVSYWLQLTTARRQRRRRRLDMTEQRRGGRHDHI
jgi:hypothetical protein